MDKVEQQVNDVLRRYCWCDSPEREQRLKDDLGIDSLRLVEVLVALEEEFGVTLKEADLDPEAIQTVGDVYAPWRNTGYLLPDRPGYTLGLR